MVIWPLPRITFQELSLVEETRPVALLTSAEAWPVVSDHLALPVLIQAEPSRYDQKLFEYLAENLPSTVEVVYAVGGGAPLEAAKVIAARNDVPLVVVPLALDGTSMLAPYAIATEPVADRQRRVRLSAAPAAEVIVDWDVILSGPESLRGAGIAEMLGIVTGLLDWRYAAQRGKNPRAERFQPWAAGVTTDLAKQAIKSATAIGQGDREALQTLLSLMAVAVQMGNLLGIRAPAGQEHHLASILAATTSPATLLAELVGPCLSAPRCTAKTRHAARRAERAGVRLIRFGDRFQPDAWRAQHTPDRSRFPLQRPQRSGPRFDDARTTPQDCLAH